jgi:membrane-bound serine protease (ClpP class)
MSDFLLQPNIAYLLLVSGFMLTLLALLTPGTGILEVGAVFVFLIAGWEAYNLPINVWALGVLVLGVIPFWLAVRKSGNLLFLALSIAALVIGSAFLFQGEGWLPAVHPLLALTVSTLSAGFLWLVTIKTLEAQRRTPTHDLGSLIGATGVAQTAIFQEGTVYVHREDWSAHSEVPIPAGSAVRVIGRDGFILRVEADEPLK